MDVTHKLEKINYFLFGTWIVGMLSDSYTSWLKNKIVVVFDSRTTIDEFLFMAGLVFIFLQVFKRGVEIQSENELTV